MNSPSRSPESTGARVCPGEATAAPGPYVLGVDSGGSGLRVALGAVGTSAPVATTVCDGPVRTGPAGIDAGHLLEQLLPAAGRLLEQCGGEDGSGIDAVAIGAAGMATLGGQLRAELPSALA
ncbi:hypothetical protein ABZY11_43890, partial [Streptomyces sp. NPDC006510]